MKREIITTADGSSTIFLPEWNEHYHSKHGALQEAYHVFIKTGLRCYLNKLSSVKEISVLEIGFGTGLNAFITLLETGKDDLKIDYTGIEAYPVTVEELEKLNYSSLFPEENSVSLFRSLHGAEWEQRVDITRSFSLHKRRLFFHELKESRAFDIIYFDAFGPRVQPELWTEEIFEVMFRALREEGVLVTYSAKGSVRRAMQAVGFVVERLPGPPGKREMLRAVKSR